MDILRDSQLVIFSHNHYFYNIFLQKPRRFFLQTLAKFAMAKTGSGIEFLRLTPVSRLTGYMSCVINSLSTKELNDDLN